MRIGKLDVEAGGMRRRVGRVWLPDGLHIWWGKRGVHLFWHRSQHQSRVTFDRLKREDGWT